MQLTSPGLGRQSAEMHSPNQLLSEHAPDGQPEELEAAEMAMF